MAVQALDAARLPIDWQKLALSAALIAVAYGLIPAYAPSYLVEAILLPFLALSLAAVGLNLLTGYCGQPSLASSAFMAVGAFAAYTFHLRAAGLPRPATVL